MSGFWTDERIEALKKHLSEGLSASQSAKLLRDGCTRNMVIAKRYRLGLSQNQEDALARRRATAAVRPPRAPELKIKPPHNPMGTKHRHPKPDLKLAGNGTVFMAVEPAPLPTTKPDLAALNETSRKLTCEELTNAVCKYGTHEEGGQQLFCGAPVRPGSRYCMGHHGFCFLPTSSAKELTRALRRQIAA